MPDLPDTLVKRSPTFEQVGLDYMGPISIKAYIGVSKRWIALFICFTTRAVHLELVDNLTAGCFLNVFRRFVARRGCPKLILSDNATQFQAVFTTLKYQGNRVTEFLAERGIIWKNIIPRAPWAGGVYERIIGLTKEALKKGHCLRERTQKEHRSPRSTEKRTPHEEEIVLVNEPETPRGM
ncbi:unnamed protein product, partial [Onchocerca ochengi]|uniref:Integrase catalytic domain-containing protein n=1 Tax=Onchocerca ochengi TaxID=42157 RepID=A0A182EXY0_ONCOC